MTDLDRLIGLLSKGLISEEEFIALKKAMLHEQSLPPQPIQQPTFAAPVPAMTTPASPVAPQAEAAIHAPEAVRTVGQNENVQKKSSGLKWIVIGVSVLVLSGGAYFGWEYLNNNRHEDKTESVKADAADVVSEASEDISEDGGVPQLNANFFVKMEGNIDGRYNIKMFLHRDDTLLSGVYYYVNTGTLLYLSGRISNGLEVDLIESTSNGNNTGHFSGTFSGTYELSGTWENASGTKRMPFEISSDNVDQIDVYTTRHERKNCSLAEQNKKNYNSEMWDMDTMCSTFKLSVLSVELANPTISALVNRSIQEKTCGATSGEFTSVEKCLEEFDGPLEFGVEKESTSDVVYFDGNILCISYYGHEYSFGAAHGNYALTYVNYDLRTGKVIGLKDIIRPGKQSELNVLVEQELRASEQDREWQFEEGTLEVDENFIIAQGGLIFVFYPYEVASFADGQPEVFVPYSKLKDLLKPGAPLPLK